MAYIEEETGEGLVIEEGTYEVLDTVSSLTDLAFKGSFIFQHFNFGFGSKYKIWSYEKQEWGYFSYKDLTSCKIILLEKKLLKN